MTSGRGTRGRRRVLGAAAAIGLLTCVRAVPAAPVPTEPTAQRQVLALWRRPIVRTGPTRRVNDSLGTPAIAPDTAAGCVVVGTGEGEVLAFGAGAGELLWRYRHGAPVDGAVSVLPPQPGAGGRTVPAMALVVGQDGQLLALRLKDGRKMWQAALEAPSRAQVTAGERRLYVATEDNQLHCLDARSGRLLWHQGRPPSAGLALLGHGRPALAQGRVVAAFSDGFLLAMDAQDGHILWERPLSLAGGRFTDADADVIVHGDTVFAASVTDGLYALDLEGGSVRWQQPLAETLSLALLPAQGPKLPEPLVVTGDVYGVVRAYHAQDGRPAWRLDARAGPAYGLVPWLDGVAFLAGRHGLVWADGASGRPRSVQALGGYPGGGLAVSGAYLAHVARDGALLFWQAKKGF